MKRGLIFRLLALSCLVGCTSVEELVPDTPGNVPEGSALLQVSVGYPQAEGYAVGDNEAAGVATSEEKEIRSVAFFVKTSHAFGKYMSTELLFSAQGLTEPLKATAEGKYTASFLVKSPKFVDGSEVLVVANYAENGLDFTDVRNIREVKTLVSKALDGSTNLTTPLLMYGQNDDVILKNTETTAASFTMERLVARVDVRNLAANATDPEKGFVLTSARLLNAPTASMILPDLLSEITGTNFPLRTVGADATRIDTLYVFENKNTNEASRTYLEINGRLKGTPVHKTIEFKKPDEAGSIGEPIALARNTRYVVQIQPLSDSTDVRFDLKVKEWDVADTVQIKPEKKAPELTDFIPDFTGAAGANVTWSEATKVLFYEAPFTGTATLRFTASGFVAPKMKVVSKDNWFTEANVALGDLQGYASESQLSRAVTLTLPESQGITTPKDALVIFFTSSPQLADTLRVRYRPDYPGTDLKPVLMAGTWFAPVNVGATKIPTKITTTWDVTTCGYLFQWGRNKPFAYGPTDDYQAGPVAYNTVQNAAGESVGEYKDKFIATSYSSSDWLLAGDPDFETRNALWTPAVNISPCPVGWRVPTTSELEKLTDQKYFPTANNIYANGILVIPSNNEPGTSLYLPAAGFRDTNGFSNYVSTDGGYWSSSLSSLSGRVRSLGFGSATVSMNSDSMSIGLPVRCVSE